MRVNGWTLFAHPLFEAEIEALERAVLRAREADPDGYRQHPAAVLLRAISRVVLVDIPSNPAHAKFRQGRTLGGLNKDWFRGKIGARFRLFFRYSSSARIIVVAWLNDEATLRRRAARSDVYEVFRSMLARGDPPRDFAALVKASRPLEQPATATGRQKPAGPGSTDTDEGKGRTGGSRRRSR